MRKLERILNLEDSMGKQWDIMRALQWNNCRAAIDDASDAVKELEMIEQAIKDGKPYDLLITDMHFAVNGKDDVAAGQYVIDELKRRGIEMPIIVCSSIRYNIPEVLGCIFYNRSRDLAWDFKEVLSLLK